MERVSNGQTGDEMFETPDIDDGETRQEAHFDRLKGRIVGKLRNAAERVSGGQSRNSAWNDASSLSGQACGWIEGLASQVEQLDGKKIKEDFAGEVRRKPGAALLIAAAAGFVVGIIWHRS